MALTSWEFAIFTAGVLAVYYLLERRAQNIWLLLASYVFYCTWSLQFAVVLAAVTIFNFLLARYLWRNNTGHSTLLWVGVGGNLLALVFFKYTNFFIPLDAVGALHIILPVGLSFITLQAISYLVDVHRGQLPPSANLIDFALYLAYFPKLISGPIERARTFLPRLNNQRIVDNSQVARSFTLIVVGLVRKVVIANFISTNIQDIFFSNPLNFQPAQLIVPLLGYAFYIYNDFAGYTSICMGISGMFGIELSPNFQQPYLARNMAEFWNSWHISLSHWLRDYIYFPLDRALLRRSGNSRNILNVAIPPVVTMLASAVWHGVALNLLVWGLLHGVYQAVERMWSLNRPVVPANQQPIWRQILSGVVVFVAVVLAWIPFRTDLANSWVFLVNMFNMSRGFGEVYWPTLALIFPSILLDLVQRQAKDDVVFLNWPESVRVGLLVVAMFAIGLAALGIPKPFVYQGF